MISSASSSGTPAPVSEDSVRDQRLEELIQAMEHILNLYASTFCNTLHS